MTIRTRFSPSPTGYIHLGNMRAALFSVLYALKCAGHFVLRIEDTDKTRSDIKYSHAIQEDLQWLNLNWQEGPYFQSDRAAVYEKYYAQLEKESLIYPCFCTDQELMLVRKTQLAKGMPPRYAGTCQALTKETIESRLAKGEKPAFRLKVPADHTIEFVDLVKGRQTFHSRDIGDFIVRRQDGTASFLFCNAIDDAEMKISHVFRGEDHLTNTPRQLLVLQALRLTPPAYGHLSMIVGDNGAPLSKRHGSFGIHEMRHAGYLPIAIVNYLARLGHPIPTLDLLSVSDLAMHFEYATLSRSPSRFDLAQLMHWQTIAVQSLHGQALFDFFGEAILSQVPTEKQSLFVDIFKANLAFPHEALPWINVLFKKFSVAEAEQMAVLKQAGPAFFQEAMTVVTSSDIGDWQKILETLQQTLQLTGKKLLLPLRLALTGKAHGPKLHDLVSLLGKEAVLERLMIAKEQAAC